jgi:hypothetical protein
MINVQLLFLIFKKVPISIFHIDTRERLISTLDKACERIQDFTDSAYTAHEHRGLFILFIL